MLKKALLLSICLALVVGLVVPQDVCAWSRIKEARTWMYIDEARELEAHPWNDIFVREDPDINHPYEFRVFSIPFGIFDIKFPTIIWFKYRDVRGQNHNTARSSCALSYPKRRMSAIREHR